MQPVDKTGGQAGVAGWLLHSHPPCAGGQPQGVYLGTEEICHSKHDLGNHGNSNTSQINSCYNIRNHIKVQHEQINHGTL